MDNLKEIESKLNALVQEEARDDYGYNMPKPLTPLVLVLAQEVIKLRDQKP